MARFPEDIEVGPDDFRRSDWRSVVASGEGEGYRGLWKTLSAAASAAIEAGKPGEGKILWLLADACSMMLNPSSLNEPFKPLMAFGGNRTALPEDLRPADIRLFSLIADEIDHAWLQARLADLVWLLERPRRPQYALLAIDAYRRIPLDARTWRRGGRECWQRAIALTRMLGAGAGQRPDQIAEQVTVALEAATAEDGLLAEWLAGLLAEYGLGRATAPVIVGRLESLARHFEGAGNTQFARAFFHASAAWFRGTGDAAKEAEMTAAEAETWTTEAAARAASAQPSPMAFTLFYEKAIQTYRTIPRTLRPAHRVNERIDELRQKLGEAGEHVLDELGRFSSSPIDITEFVINARHAVSGKAPAEALVAFCSIHSGTSVAQLRESATKTLQEHPLLALIPGVHYSSDGRVVAKSPGLDLTNPESRDTQAAIWAHMIRDYLMGLSLVVRASIWPAYEVLVLEHRLCEGDFIEIARNSPVVPGGRERLFGKALFAGYDGDFTTALHLLIPQLEHLVRVHLKAARANTTTLDGAGVESEIGLSALMELPQAPGVFGEDLAFELDALFCDPLGPNLRNELAHGLLEPDKCQSEYSVYAWWLGLRLVFNAFWRSTRRASAEDESDHSG